MTDILEADQDYRASRTVIPVSFQLIMLSHAAKNLYNKAMYWVRQQYFETGYIMWYKVLWHYMKWQPEYRDLPTKSAQLVLRDVVDAWKGYVKALQSYYIDPSAFTGKPKPPQYAKANGLRTIRFTNQQFRVKHDTLLFSRGLRLPAIPVHHLSSIIIKEVRIVPQGAGFIAEMLYENPANPTFESSDIQAAIDFGTTNFVTLASTSGDIPRVICGKPLKTVIQWANKQIAELQQAHAAHGLDHDYLSQKRLQIDRIREKSIEEQLHQISAWIVRYCQQWRIDTLVVGYNPLWKQAVNLGKKTNQTFVQLPHARLIQKLTYKCHDAGIHLILEPEAYTSKCSFLDQEPVQKHKHYKGHRIKRGLFRTENGTLINADVNAAYNILSKVVPSTLSRLRKLFPSNRSAEGAALHPTRHQLVSGKPIKRLATSS